MTSKKEKELKLYTEDDQIIATLYGLADRLDVLIEKYPRAVKEVFKSRKLEISRDSWKYIKRKPTELHRLVEAQLLVDKLSNSE